MSAEMPTQPLLLRTSAPNSRERTLRRLALAAREVPIAELSSALQVSSSTAARRRRGRGWTVSEVARLAALLGVRPSSLLSDGGSP